MNEQLLMKIYNRLPVGFQNLICSYEGMKIQSKRYNKKFWQYYYEYEKLFNLSYEEAKEYRNNRIKRLLKYSQKNVPYYTNVFKKLGFDYNDFNDLSDLNSLPMINKTIVKENFNSFISNKYPFKKMVLSHTSGTTGGGFKFYTTKESINEQWALWWNYRKRLSIKFNEKCGLFGGRSVVPVSQEKPPFWRYNKPCNQVYFSAYHLTEDNLISYLDEIDKQKITWLHGYPSVLNILADFILNSGYKFQTKINVITTGAENLFTVYSDKIHKAFGIIPYQHYGLSEGVANFSQNINHEMYVDEIFAAVEFLKQAKNKPLKVVGTNLTNYAMPLIRYDTGDLAEFEENDNGRRVLSLDGRDEDYVIMPNGAKVGRLDHIFKDMVNIKEAQIIQNNIHEIDIHVVKSKDYSGVDEKALLDEISLRLDKMKINILYFDQIQKTKSGKLRFVISNINKE